MNIWNTWEQDSYNRVEEMSKIAKEHSQAMQDVAVIRSRQLHGRESVLTRDKIFLTNLLYVKQWRLSINFSGIN